MNTVAIPSSILQSATHVVRSVSGQDLRTLLSSPELYPVNIELQKGKMAFVRMSRETYRNSVFLDTRTQHLGREIYEIRLDDILLRAAGTPTCARRTHYIFHPTFSCSTLLARYFELIPGCFVLKEPSLLTQLALISKEAVREWDQILQVSLRLLTRTYQPDELVIIKAHEPCNVLAETLLEQDQNATATFLITPLRQFVLSVLKSEFRRNWVRTRIPAVAIAAECAALAQQRAENLTDGQAAAFLWLVNRFLCGRLCATRCCSRVYCLEADRLISSPKTALGQMMRNCGLALEEAQIDMMIGHPSIQRHAKDTSRQYGANQRRLEMAELERRFAVEADLAVEWAGDLGMDCDLPDSV
jgi:hypothetical protein